MLTGRRVSLQIVSERHAEFLYHLLADPRAGGRVRFRGATPSPSEVQAGLWDHVLAQFVVEGRDSGDPMGLVVLTSADFGNRTCYVSVIGHPAVHGTGLAMEGLVLAVDYAFRTWDLRKVYFDVVASNLPQFGGSLDRYAELEGCRRGYQYHDGEYLDLHQFVLTVETWRGRRAQRLVAAVSGPPRDASRDGSGG